MMILLPLLFVSNVAFGMADGAMQDVNTNGKRSFSKLTIDKVFNIKRSHISKEASFSEEVNRPDANGNTQMHLAVMRAKKDKRLVEDLIKQGADINQRNKEKDFPLKMAYMCSNKELVKYLIKHGADINQQDRYGNTLLHLATLENDEKMMTYFVEHGARINQENEFEQTPLHFSTLWGNEKIISYLINHGADMDKRDKNGQTPFDIAKQKGNEKAVDCLLKYMVEQV